MFYQDNEEHLVLKDGQLDNLLNLAVSGLTRKNGMNFTTHSFHLLLMIMHMSSQGLGEG